MQTEPHPIRQAQPEDLPVLAGMIRDAYRDVALRFGLTPENCPKHPSNCTDEWIRRDWDRGVTYYLLHHGQIPVGCAALEMADAGTAYLERLAVLPAHRKRGYGRALARHVVTCAAAAGAGRVSIGIIAAQTELKHWYARMGFVEGETRAFAHLPFSVTFMMSTVA